METRSLADQRAKSFRGEADPFPFFCLDLFAPIFLPSFCELRVLLRQFVKTKFLILSLLAVTSGSAPFAAAQTGSRFVISATNAPPAKDAQPAPPGTNSNAAPSPLSPLPS